MSATATQLQKEADRAKSAWQSVVAQVPTLFGKLWWVSSFRVAGSDRYQHAALEQMFSREVTSEVLKESHQHLFNDWLSLGLRDQHEDFTEYVRSLPGMNDPKDFFRDAGEKLMPPSALKPQELLFDTDLAVIIELLD